MTRKILLLGKKGRLSSVMLRMKQQSSGPIIKNGEEGCERFLLSPYLSRALPSPGTNMIYYYQVSLPKSGISHVISYNWIYIF